MAREAATRAKPPVEVVTAAGDGISAFVRGSPFLMAQLDDEGRLLAISGGWLLEGVEPASAMACGKSSLTSEPCGIFVDCLEAGQARAIIKRQVSGRERAFDVHLSRMESANAAPTIIACATDITALLVELEDGNRQRDLALRIAGIFWRDVNYKTGELKVTGANARMHEIFCRDLQDMHHVAAEYRSAVQREIITGISERRPFHIRYCLASSTGQETYVETIGEYIFDASGKPERLFSVIRDVTDERRSQRQIEELALRDSLTGLGNRALFQQELSAAVTHHNASGEGLGLIILDVDHFKSVNDSMGHDAGDALLRSLGNSIKVAFLGTGTSVRLGGDEFAIIVHGATDEAALQRPIAILRELLNEPVLHNSHEFLIKVSIGGALLQHTITGEQASLLKKADVALYEAKSSGRNRTAIYKPE